MSNINLDINNFGPINKANIELRKLNIVSGVNGSGKTTASKLLYCFLTSNSNEKEYLANISINERFESIITDLHQNAEFDSKTLIRLNKLFIKFPGLTDKNYNDKLKTHISSLKKIIDESQMKNKENYLEKLNTIEYALEVNSMEHRKFFDVSNVLLRTEFKIKDLKLDNPNVQIYGKQNDYEFSYGLDFHDSKLGFITDKRDLDYLNVKNIIYIDSPSIFNTKTIENTLILKNQPYHLRFLSRMMNVPENNEDVHDSIFNQKLDEFKEKITNLIGGYIYYDEDEEEFMFKKGNDEYSMKNTASGIKQMGIIQRLLSNRTLSENSFLIIDEPEVSLHPEWQIKFAEILVLLANELNCTLYLNTHSPFMAEAIEVYSKYYRVYDETAFYLTEKVENEEKYDYTLMDDEDIIDVYNNLGYSYNTLNDLRFKTELRDELGE